MVSSPIYKFMGPEKVKGSQLKGIKRQTVNCRFRSWLDSNLWDRSATKAEIFRLKGFVNIAEGRCRKIVQAVHETYDLEDVNDQRNVEGRVNEIVVIGRRLNEEQMIESLSDCVSCL